MLDAHCTQTEGQGLEVKKSGAAGETRDPQTLEDAWVLTGPEEQSRWKVPAVRARWSEAGEHWPQHVGLESGARIQGPLLAS